MVANSLLRLVLFLHNNFAKFKKKSQPFPGNLTLWLKKYIFCVYFRVAMAHHAAIGPLYIMLEIYVGQKDWIPRTKANIALIGIGCWKFNKFLILFLEEKVDFLKNHLLKIFKIFIRYSTNNYLPSAAKLKFESLFV